MKIVWNRSFGWNMSFNGMEKFGQGTLPKMDITQIVTDGPDCYPWTETFVMWPKKSITGHRLFWQRAYKRKVWVVWGSGFHMEPEVQYATAFDMIADPYEPLLTAARKDTPWGG